MKIGVYGSATGELSDKTKEKARELGLQIAKKGHIVVTGACLGLPYEAVLGAYEVGGKCIGYSPAPNKDIHISKYQLPAKEFDELVFVPKDYNHADDQLACRKYRNISSVYDVDAAVFVGGETGSMNEFTNAYDFGKKIGVLEESGGITDGVIQALLKKITKKTGAYVIFNSDPIALVDEIVKE